MSEPAGGGSAAEVARARFVLEHTALSSTPLLPEIRLHLATEVTPLWQATEAWLSQRGVPPPFWAFAWAGGQALARYVLDHPEVVRGRAVLDFASGSGVVGIAAALAGASRVLAADIDLLALAAIGVNAEVNRVHVETTGEDLLGRPADGLEVVLVGDVFYEEPLASRAAQWAAALAREGVLVLAGDAGRSYAPDRGLALLARYVVPTSIDLESRDTRPATVWRAEA